MEKMSRPLHILTFDIEEWFHIDFKPRPNLEAHWEQFESRIHTNMDTIFRMLDTVPYPATFFCIGWVARKYPEVIRRIDRYGHEIGSHSDLHQVAYSLDPDAYRQDFRKAIDSLEQVTGKKVRSYRAPAFSIRPDNRWAFETLIENGIEVDCSIFPVYRDYGGFSDFGAAQPCWVEYQGSRLREFPMNYARAAGNRGLVFSGGGYFRLLPYPLIRRLFRQQPYVMAYFHPRDFDAGQPMLEGISRWQRFKSYVGLKEACNKFERLLKDFEFVDLREAERQVDWERAPVIRID